MHALSFLTELQTMLAEGPVALATVLEVDGSVPRGPGAMMARRGTREVGTVGGGAMEARILTVMDAVAADTGRACVRRESIDLGGRPDAVRDGICGGAMTIEVRRVDAGPGPGDRAAVDAVAGALAAGRSAVLAAGPDGLRAEGGDDVAGPDAGFTAGPDGWRLVLRPRPLLLVIGGGHCGVALARHAELLDFDVIIEDDRDEVRARIAATPRTTVVAGPTQATLATVEPSREVHAALVTRSFRQDLDALAALRGGRASSVGVMGSRRRLGTVFRLLREAGWSPEELAALDAPIGLDIGAETPAEIAVSIMGGLIARRAGRSAASAAAAAEAEPA
jgi:xanthine dehydrogenase accessory factor